MPCPGSKEGVDVFEFGAPDVIILPGDVADPDDYNRFVQATIDHYGQCKSAPLRYN